MLPNLLESPVGYCPCSKRSRTGSSLQRVTYRICTFFGSRRNKICGLELLRSGPGQFWSIKRHREPRHSNDICHNLLLKVTKNLNFHQ